MNLIAKTASPGPDVSVPSLGSRIPDRGPGWGRGGREIQFCSTTGTETYKFTVGNDHVLSHMIKIPYHNKNRTYKKT